MIRTFELRNFKAFKDLTLRFGAYVAGLRRNTMS